MKQCEEFAKEIAWKHPHFADRRNKEKRSLNQTKYDVVRGKMAEVAVYQVLKEMLPNAILEPIDFNVYPQGVFDKGDIIINDRNISIKSSKPYSSCLMIEKDKFTIEKGVATAVDKQPLPDYFIFVHVDDENRLATIKGIITSEEFWDKKTFLPRGMYLNYLNAKKAMIDKINPNNLPTGKGSPLLADNYGIHIEQLDPLHPSLFQKQVLINA